MKAIIIYFLEYYCQNSSSESKQILDEITKKIQSQKSIDFITNILDISEKKPKMNNDLKKCIEWLWIHNINTNYPKKVKRPYRSLPKKLK
jgi:hypothetical protein